MIITKELIWDELSIYLEYDSPSSIYLMNLQKLSKWFGTNEFTNEIYKSIMNLSLADIDFDCPPRKLTDLKAFASNYFIVHDNLNRETFKIATKFMIKEGELRQNISTILNCEFCTEELMIECLSYGYIGDSNLNFLVYNKLSEKAILKLYKFIYSNVEEYKKSNLFTKIIKTQDLTDEIAQYLIDMIGMTDNDIIGELVIKGYKLSFVELYKLLKEIISDNDWSLTSPTIILKKAIIHNPMILKNQDKIMELIYLIDGSENRAIVFSGILVTDNINGFYLEKLLDDETVLEQLIYKFDLQKIDNSVLFLLAQRTGRIEFMPQETQELFLV